LAPGILTPRNFCSQLHGRRFFLGNVFVLRNFFGPWFWLDIWLFRRDIRLFLDRLNRHCQLLIGSTYQALAGAEGSWAMDDEAARLASAAAKT
jgi:hypothetical protein